ncbi:InlB B-repeat-containing protein [Aliikangiella coralliicola]|uniref:Bacterial repeat domain-containing protein n=1 Tax=Aliikangiella coralliicola TaxID=2592383 RepID=A0A545UHG0_9GAMM|nr:SdiA-regulated domain-containing protein [Aliikangiella coralliicola]TQV88902.1 hypothetical protein FLL46_05035 [Aliikangiella coralliicola]
MLNILKSAFCFVKNISLLACFGILIVGCGGEDNETASISPSPNPNTTYTLTTTATGSGTITSSVAGIDCGSDCTEDYSDGQQLTLTATPASGFEFQAWQGDCAGQGASCSLTIDSDKNATAVFVVATYTLTTTVNGPGSIASNIDGINCGSDCTNDYSAEQQIVLTATPDSGFIFQNWEGDCAGQDETCSLTMDSDKNATAFFAEALASYTVTVTKTGNGTIVSEDESINCGSVCELEFDAGTQLKLIATSDVGHQLSAWTGADCGFTPSCTFTVSRTMEIGGSFTAVVDDGLGGSENVMVSDYSQTNDAFQVGQISNNASGITWHAGIQQYLVVQNNAARIYRFNTDFLYLGEITKSGNINSDTEGLAHLAGNQVMIVTEANYAHKAVIDSNTTNVNGSYDVTPGYRLLGSPRSNKGFEGVATRPASGNIPARVYACQEGTRSDSQAHMRVVYFDVPSPDPDDLMRYDDDLVVVEPFDAEAAFSGVITDCAGMVYDPRTGHLLIVSQESAKVIQVNRTTGEVLDELSLTGAPQYEGVTIGPNGELVFVSEANWIHIFQRQ